MNRRIKKKKLKQRLTQEEAIEQLSIKLAEAIFILKNLCIHFIWPHYKLHLTACCPPS